jgi:hypothetical protein
MTPDFWYRKSPFPMRLKRLDFRFFLEQTLEQRRFSGLVASSKT